MGLVFVKNYGRFRTLNFHECWLSLIDKNGVIVIKVSGSFTLLKDC